MASENNWIVRPATVADIPALFRLIKGLAEYENLQQEVAATEQELERALFGESSTPEALIATAGGDAVGYALFFQNFSTFLGRPGLYLEDLFVIPSHRGRGIGRSLLARVARIAVERRSGRLEWAVLDWNQKAIGFYERLGAKAMSEWTIYRISGGALTKLAERL